MTKYSIEKKLYVKGEAKSMKRVLTESEGIHIQAFFKVACYSFQYFSRLRVWWVIIIILYRLTPKSWYQQIAQSSGNKLLLVLWHNRLATIWPDENTINFSFKGL